MPTTLSERDSKALLAPFGIPLAAERLVTSPDAAADAAKELGYPVAVKLCGDNIAHKTERGLVRLGLADPDAVAAAAADLLDAARPEDQATGVLVAPMVSGNRELIAGIATDPQFGRTVLVGVGGILTEAIADASIRRIPITLLDAEEMIDDLATQSLLGPFRGEPPVDRAGPRPGPGGALRRGRGPPGDRVGRPQPVDRVRGPAGRGRRPGGGDDVSVDAKRFEALFNPKGVVIAGASTHPGKFGFVSLHNLLSAGYAGNVFATNLEGSPVLGIPTLRSIEELPEDQADLIFVCTPKSANPDLLRSAAAKGITAAFLTSAGYGEAGRRGPARRGRADRPVRRARHPPRRSERPGRGFDAGLDVRPDRGSVPAGRFDRRGQPVRQLRLELHELGLRDRCRDLACRLRRQRGRHLGRRLPALLRRGSRDVGRARLRRGHRGRSSGRRWADRGRSSHAASSWSRAGRPREEPGRPRATPVRSPPTTRTFDGICRQAGVDACGDDRGGVRGRRHLCDPAPARRATASSS